MADDRVFEIVKSPLKGAELLPTTLTVAEELGRLFEIQLEFLSSNEELPFEKLLGEPIVFKVRMGPKGERFYNGIVSRFTQVGRRGGYAVYVATLRPWLWLLTRSGTSRIFQDKTAPQIIETVLKESALGDFEMKVDTGKYKHRSYCVQYRESDFNFLSRLMEQEGIFYYFTHEKETHLLKITDQNPQKALFPGYEKIPFVAVVEDGESDQADRIDDWTLSKKVQPGRFTLNDYDFKRPQSAERLISRSAKRDHSHSESEVYDYPGWYFREEHGKHYVQTRLEEAQAQFETIHALGRVRGISAGSVFELEHHPRSDQNRKYLVVEAVQEYRNPGYESGAGPSQGEDVVTSLMVMDLKEPFRPARSTPRPIMPGPQTATVVGEKQDAQPDEVVTDALGRVRVIFHWVRDLEHPEHADRLSCWIRVMQIWAGNRWGAQFLPRVGHEVVVDFVEGDPDRPLIVGSVYNARHMPPFELPDNATQSGIKSRSTKDGTLQNFNEIRFEDKKGAEQIIVHAERNLDTTVEADESRDVGGSRTTQIHKNETLTVDGNRETHVKGSFKETIDTGETRTVHAGFSETIDGGETRTVDGGSTETINGGATQTINGGLTQTINGGETRTVNGGVTETISGGETRTVSGGITETVVGAINQSATGGVNAFTPATYVITALGGCNVIAPAGVNVAAPSKWFKYSPVSVEVTHLKTTLYPGAKIDIGSLAVAINAMKVDLSSVKVDLCKGVFKNHPVEIDQISTTIKLGALSILTCGLKVIQ